jgi:sn-glycerol 3-phosphate transport system permease protein
MEKRVRFRSTWLPWLLVAPQMAVVLVFFFWPAAQALYQSVLQQDAFGIDTEFVGLENFRASGTTKPTSRRSRPRPCSRCWWPWSGSQRVAAAGGDGRPRDQGLGTYKTLLIWPYAVAPVVAGVLWLFMFAPSSAWSASAAPAGHGLEPPAQRRPRHGPDRDGRRLEADLLQLPVLPGRAAVIPKSLIEAAAIDGAGPWRRFWTIVSSRCSRPPPSSCW